jgi:streptogramin lyase
MRFANGLVLMIGGVSVAVACGGSSEVQLAPSFADAGTGGDAGDGGMSKGGKAGKGGAGGKGGAAGKGGDSGAAGAEDNGGTGQGASGGSAGVGADGGVGGAGGSGALGGVGADGGLGGGFGADGGVGGTGEGGFGNEAGVGGSAVGGIGGEGGEPTGPGSLRVIVSRPAGAQPVSVSVDGPNGFTSTIASTTVFSSVDPGGYNVSASVAVVPGPIVSTVFDPLVAGNPATVQSQQQANVSITYPFVRGGSGRLWATDYGNGAAAAFDAGRLVASGAAGADLALSITGNGRTATALAFDTEGNAWIGDCGSEADIAKVTPTTLGGTGAVTTTPAVLLGAPAETWARCVVSLEFDAEGSLFATFNSRHIAKYTADQLLASSDPSVPATVFSATNFTSLQDATFDNAGNLWVSAYSSGTVSKLTPEQLQTTNTNITPAAVWSVPQAEGLVMGPDGNLWVASYDNKVRAYDPTSITLPAPARSIDLPAGFGPVGIAFDESGNLWAISFNFGTIIRIDAANLTSDGAKTPSVELTNTGILSGAALTFNPVP